VWDVLEEVIEGHGSTQSRSDSAPIRIQAFEPILVEGRYPVIRWCVRQCGFDGDQMAVHVPLSLESQTEARLLMLASNNVMSPARQAKAPSQDMVLCYYLTAENPNAQRGWAVLDDAIMAYEQQQVDLHALVWVRFDGKVEQAMKIEPLQVETDGMVTSFTQRRRRECIWKSDCPVHSYNSGRIIYNRQLLRCYCVVCCRRVRVRVGVGGRAPVKAQECCFALAFFLIFELPLKILRTLP